MSNSSSRGPAPFGEVTGDDAILNFIFNRGGPGAIFSSPDLSPPPKSRDEFVIREAEAVSLAEAGHYDAALPILNDICLSQPCRASSFNNWAQLFKLLGRLEAQKADVDTAIQLAKQWLCDRSGSSHGPEHEREVKAQKDILKQAYAQRAVYFL